MRHTTVRYLFENSSELATVNGQLRANLTPQGFRASAEKATGKQQPDANSQIHVNWQLATGSQMSIQVVKVFEHKR